MQRSDYARLAAAAAQLLGRRPTRAALVWSTMGELRPYPDVEQELAFCAANCVFPSSAPSNSLGDACMLFRWTHRGSPMPFNCDVIESAGAILASRRLLLNDILHALLEFDASWAGQLGVFSFVAAQNYCPQFDHAARALRAVYMTAAPWLREDLGAAEYRGRRLAARAPRVLTAPIEREWHTPLFALQVRLNLKRPTMLRPLDIARPAVRALAKPNGIDCHNTRSGSVQTDKRARKAARVEGL